MKKILVLFSILFVYALLMTGNVAAQEKAKFVLEPDIKNLKSGQDLKLNIKLNTGDDNGTNSYQLILNYPQDKLTFNSIDTTASPFDMALQSSGGDGVVKIIRGSAKTLQGELVIGTVSFKANANVSSDTIQISNESAVINSADNKNILAGSTIENSQGNPPLQSQPQQPSTASNNQFSTTFSNVLKWFQNIFSSLFK